jgi:hypothetical protein
MFQLEHLSTRLVDLVGIEPEERVKRPRLGQDDDAGKCAQEPGHERRSTPREVKDYARRLKRRLRVESHKRVEPSPDKRPGARAKRPAGDGLVEERFDEVLRREVGPVDRRGGTGKVEPHRRPVGEFGELHQASRWYRASAISLTGQPDKQSTG